GRAVVPCCLLGGLYAGAGVTVRYIEAGNRSVRGFGDRETGGIVFGAVDAQAGGQALQGGAERGLRGVEVALSVERGNVGVDRLGHDVSPGRSGWSYTRICIACLGGCGAFVCALGCFYDPGNELFSKIGRASCRERV